MSEFGVDCLFAMGLLRSIAVQCKKIKNPKQNSHFSLQSKSLKLLHSIENNFKNVLAIYYKY
jgi:hypothetical protein